MEDYHILQNIIKQGLDNGFMGGVIKDASNQTIEMSDGKWRLSGGFEVGSTWDIILNPEFAKSLWGEEEYRQHLTNVVVLSVTDRVNYLREFIHEEKHDDTEVVEKQSGDMVDALMHLIRQANIDLKDISEGLYEDSCNNCYSWAAPVMKKTSVTSLVEQDYIYLNAANKATGGAIYEYLRQNGRTSFGRCPDCGQEELKHDQTCSIETKTMDWLTRQNDGC